VLCVLGPSRGRTSENEKPRFQPGARSSRSVVVLSAEREKCKSKILTALGSKVQRILRCQMRLGLSSLRCLVRQV